MKRGDKIPVTIAGHEVTYAEVKEVGDGTAVLIVPATRVEFGTRTELTDLPEKTPEGASVIIDTAVDKPATEPVESVPAPVVDAPVPAPASTDEAVQIDTVKAPEQVNDAPVNTTEADTSQTNNEG